jgi:zinc transport system substrate-binding protein
MLRQRQSSRPRRHTYARPAAPGRPHVRLTIVFILASFACVRSSSTALVVALLALGACGGSTAGGGGAGRPRVVASVYPLAFVAEEVGGGRVDVGALTPAGAEPHDLELTSHGVRLIGDADLLLYLGGGFQPAIDEVVPDLDAPVDVLAEITGVEAGDPHVWLDPVLMAEVADLVSARLTDLNPRGAGTYERNARSLKADLLDLDKAYHRGLDECRLRAFVTSHDAFGYLARRYDLQQVGIAGIDPEAEPTPQSVLEAARFAESNGVTTIFYESLVSPQVAETVASEVGVSTDVLDPLESRPRAGDYLSAMRTNLGALEDALGCRAPAGDHDLRQGTATEFGQA